MDKQKILITGGAGFIGSNIANHLHTEGFDVTVIDNLYIGKRENILSDVPFEKVDVTDFTSLKNIFQKKRFDYVFHFAAFSSNPMLREKPVEGMNVNIGGFVNIIQLCKDFNIKKLIYASTSSIYSGNSPPFKETDAVSPKIHYEVSLYARELIAGAYLREFNVHSAGLRFFSVYGYNEMHKGIYANLVSQFLWSMLKKESPVIYGDGEQTRDFVFIDDIIQAAMLLIKTDGEGIFNVGSGKNHSLNQVVDIINKKLNMSIKPTYIENPLRNYVFHTKADITKIRQFGFFPTTSLDEGIEHLVQFYKNNR